MLIWSETSSEPRLCFAWRPVYARAAPGRPAGYVWLEQVVAEYIEGPWGGGWHYRRVPNPHRYSGHNGDRVPEGAHASGSYGTNPPERGEQDQFGGPRLKRHVDANLDV